MDLLQIWRGHIISVCASLKLQIVIMNKKESRRNRDPMGEEKWCPFWEINRGFGLIYLPSSHGQSEGRAMLCIRYGYFLSVGGQRTHHAMCVRTVCLFSFYARVCVTRICGTIHRTSFYDGFRKSCMIIILMGRDGNRSLSEEGARKEP